jgi:hypothetical protein
MKNIIYITLSLLILTSCTKEVEIDIPGFETQLVIDGRIETGLPPIIFLSESKEVYAPTDINAFLNGFISGATITMSNGTGTIELEELCSGSLPAGTQEIVAGILGIPVNQLVNYNICAYTSTDPLFFGEIGKTYTLNVNHNGEVYTAETIIQPPTSLTNTFWLPDGENTNYGYSWATLSDPANQYDAYMWEVKRINTDINGDPIDASFTKTYSPVFDDDFFDGLSFEFWYENPITDPSEQEDSTRYKFALGDTLVIKLSKMDRPVFEFYEKKYMQLQTAGNPFATPTNIVNNISGNALGIWAGFSPSFDTLICIP